MREATGIRRHRLRALFVKGREREHSGAGYLNCIFSDCAKQRAICGTSDKSTLG